MRKDGNLLWTWTRLLFWLRNKKMIKHRANELEVDILEQKMRPSRWPFTYLLLDPERSFEDVQIGWLFKCLGLTILRIKWPTFIYGTATTGIVEKGHSY